MPKIRVPREVWNLIERANAPRGVDTTKSVFHPDGTVEFPVDYPVYKRLLKLDRDPEIALRKLLGDKSN